MSRHRDVRNMDYSEDYDGYDDVYGHSVDDDFYISPSNRQFMFNRENSREQGKIGEFNQTEQDIQEEDEADLRAELSDTEKAKVESCIEQIKATLGPVNLSKNELTNIIISHNYDIEKSINTILTSPKPPQRERVYIPPTAVVTGDYEVAGTKVVASGGKTTVNVTKGFELPQKDSVRLNTTPRSQSPASGRGTPVIAAAEAAEDITRSASKNKEPKIDVAAQYKKERGSGKEHLYMVVIGHVDAGKSTLMGHLLFDLGQVNQKTMHKYEQESRKLGKQSFLYAWVLDETGEERSRGITMDVGRSQFETKTKQVILLDAPGHKDFIPNMISGANQADVAVLVVDATRGEFETGFESGGQTREHALLARSLGVTQLAVAINKLDTVSWSKERFDEIIQKLKSFLKMAGFNQADVTFVPCSGLTGQNLTTKPTENELLTWYTGPCLLEVIDGFRVPERPVTKPFRFSINDIYKGTGSGFCVSGRVESGSLNVGDRVMVCPNKELSIAKSLLIDDVPQTVVFAGDQATVTLSGIEMQNVALGNILCDPQTPVQVSTKFQGTIVVFNLAVPITKGCTVVLHHQSLVEPAVVTKLISHINRSTGEVIKKHPRFLNSNTSAIVEMTIAKPIALELYSECKELGRFMLRVGGVTVAAGLITKILL